MEIDALARRDVRHRHIASIKSSLKKCLMYSSSFAVGLIEAGRLHPLCRRKIDDGRCRQHRAKQRLAERHFAPVFAGDGDFNHALSNFMLWAQIRSARAGKDARTHPVQDQETPSCAARSSCDSYERQMRGQVSKSRRSQGRR